MRGSVGAAFPGGSEGSVCRLQSARGGEDGNEQGVWQAGSQLGCLEHSPVSSDQTTLGGKGGEFRLPPASDPRGTPATAASGQPAKVLVGNDVQHRERGWWPDP